MTTDFDFEYSVTRLSPVMMERLRARIARRPGRWRRRMRRQRSSREGSDVETRRAA